VDLPEYHGTGSTYAPALASGLSLGKDVAAAAVDVEALVTSATISSLNLSAGYVSVNAFTDKLASYPVIKRI
jgi:hydroxymethylpyrimidine/phosphomethylpyrimidine kinase